MAIPQVSRVQCLEIENFRGFVGRKAIDTDADIVVLEGPNGFGKTSFLQAVTLLLTQWHAYQWDKEPLIPLFARVPLGVSGGDDTKRSESFAIRGQVEVAHYNGDATLECAPGTGRPEISVNDRNTTVTRPQELPKHRLGDEEHEPPERVRELERRLCAFFQDDVERLFDVGTQGKTVRDVIEPPPIFWQIVPDRLEEFRSRESKLAARRAQIDREENRPPPDSEHSLDGLQQTFREVRDWLVGVTQEIEQAPEPPGSISAEDELAAWAEGFLEARGLATKRSDARFVSGFLRALSESLKAQIDDERRCANHTVEGREDKQARLGEVEAELKAFDEDWPNLESELAAFSAEDEGTPDALSVFMALKENAAAWGDPGALEDDIPELQRALSELRAVRDVDAAKCVQTLDDWLEPRRQAKKRRDELEREWKRLDSRLKEAVSSKELNRLRALQNEEKAALKHLQAAWERERDRLRWERETGDRQRALQYLEDAEKAVEEMDDVVKNVTSVDEGLMKGIKTLADEVAGRFSMVDGIRPLQLNRYPEEQAEGNVNSRGYDIRTADKRRLAEFSTGQRGQLAVSFLVAQNLAVWRYLAHQIIILDDVTTAYDLSNLTREAILWRQLAYGRNDAKKRQVFISSHHEDMTNHLLDLLVPPKLKSMRLLRFVDWSPENGPKIEQYKVEPTGRRPLVKREAEGEGGPESEAGDSHDWDKLNGLCRDIGREKWVWS